MVMAYVNAVHHPLDILITFPPSNKWVLNTTEAPLFFLFSQLVIAVLLFLACHAGGLLKVPLQFDKQTVHGLIPMIGLNIIGLGFASTRSINNGPAD